MRRCQTKLPCAVFKVNRLNRPLISCVRVSHKQTLLWGAACHRGALVHWTNGPLLLPLCKFFGSLLVVCQGTAELFGDFLVKNSVDCSFFFPKGRLA